MHMDVRMPREAWMAGMALCLSARTVEFLVKGHGQEYVSCTELLVNSRVR